MRYDRQLLRGEPKRSQVLALREVQQYGADSFGDPDYVSLYGLKPAAWYARGVRILGRTAVECTRDRLGDLIGRDVAEFAHAALDINTSVIDPFRRLGEHAPLDAAPPSRKSRCGLRAGRGRVRGRP
jgi:hypothetical protein